ncbi:hypothetical protein NKDENANG_02722 [Candidatus Entotheonellaceae bacterium PAL068K]
MQHNVVQRQNRRTMIVLVTAIVALFLTALSLIVLR